MKEKKEGNTEKESDNEENRMIFFKEKERGKRNVKETK